KGQATCWSSTAFKNQRRTNDYERKNRCLAGHVGSDGFEDTFAARKTAWIWPRAPHRANQRQSARDQSGHFVSGVAQTGAGRFDRIRVGCIREQSARAFLSDYENGKEGTLRRRA